jgi:hypothetical protein
VGVEWWNRENASWTPSVLTSSVQSGRVVALACIVREVSTISRNVVLGKTAHFTYLRLIQVFPRHYG